MQDLQAQGILARVLKEYLEIRNLKAHNVKFKTSPSHRRYLQTGRQAAPLDSRLLISNIMYIDWKKSLTSAARQADRIGFQHTEGPLHNERFFTMNASSQ